MQKRRMFVPSDSKRGRQLTASKGTGGKKYMVKCPECNVLGDHSTDCPIVKYNSTTDDNKTRSR